MSKRNELLWNNIPKKNPSKLTRSNYKKWVSEKSINNNSKKVIDWNTNNEINRYLHYPKYKS